MRDSLWDALAGLVIELTFVFSMASMLLLFNLKAELNNKIECIANADDYSVVKVITSDDGSEITATYKKKETE